MIKVLSSLISILGIILYRSVRVRMGKITEANLSRYLIFNLIFGIFTILLIVWEQEGISMFFAGYIYFETLLLGIRYAFVGIARDLNNKYKSLTNLAYSSIKIKKEKDSYRLTLSWWPMKIYIFLYETHKFFKILSYKTMDYLHQYIPFIPGDHDKVSGVPKRWVNETIAKMHKSAKKEKIGLQIIQVYFQDDLVDFTVLVTPKKTRNWLKGFETEFVKNTKITNCYVRKISSRPPTLQIIIPRSEIL